jgi:thiamine pyrophosphate-dependent acetolactate synthase large subunit-like protein
LDFAFWPRAQIRQKAQIIQIDICPEELGNARNVDVPLFGDINLTVAEIGNALGNWRFQRDSDWWKQLDKKCQENKMSSQELSKDHSLPLNYYAVFGALKETVINYIFFVTINHSLIPKKVHVFKRYVALVCV